jgi:hypothetical protein
VFLPVLSYRLLLCGSLCARLCLPGEPFILNITASRAGLSGKMLK